MSGDEAEENAVVNNVRENENNAVITVQDGDAPVNQAQFKVLFDSIQALSRSTETLKGQFFAFKDDSTEQVAKKAKMDTKSYDFKKKGNDNQFRFTKEIEGCFDDIERELGRISGAEGRSATALEKAKESLKKDILCTSQWRTIGQLEDPELKALASSLPDIVFKARADSTTKKYIYAFNRWKKWSEAKREICTFPVQPTHFVLFLQHLADSTGSRSAVEEAVNAISWAHKVAGLQSFENDPMVQMVLNGFKRVLAKPKSKKRPVTVEMLRDLVGSMSSDITLAEARLAAICLLAFSAFLRFDEISKLKCNDIEFQSQHMVVYIRSSKTDQYRQGNEVLIARTASVTCPVAMLERYISIAAIDTTSELRLFRGLVHTKNGMRLRASGSVSYTRIKELVKDKLVKLGYDSRQFGLHSFRAGGATAAAKAQVKDRLFKRHGRWKTETAKDGYVEDTITERLKVSQSLGL